MLYFFLLSKLLFVAPAVFLLGVLVLMVTRLLTGPAPGDDRTAWAIVFRVFAWMCLVGGFLVGTYLVLPGLAILWLATLAVIIAVAYGKQVATQQYALLALVGAAAERSMPLVTAFSAFGQERGGWMRRRTMDIVDLLSDGAPLPDALREVPGALPPEAVPLVCVGHQNGSLGPAIRQAIATRNLYEPVWQSIVPKIGYICFLPAATMGILSFIILTIIPQYEKIFKDFNTKLPDFTVGLLEACRSGHLWLLLGAVWLFSAALLAYCVLRYTGSIRWDLPGTAWLLRRRHVGTVLDAVALAAQRQRPLGEALSTLGLAYPQPSIRRRLGAVCDEVEAGGDDLSCLHRHGLLGEADLALLQSARRNGNLAWSAEEMADSNRRRFVYRVYALLQTIFPAVIVSFGLLIATIPIAMFLPLIALIANLSGGR